MVNNKVSGANRINPKILFISGAALMLLLGLAGAFSPRRASLLGSGQAMKLVAAENFWGDIAKQIGGDKVAVTSIITDPSADPHLYESNAKNAATTASADVTIENGLGYDDFFDKLLTASQSNHRSQLSAAKILNITEEGANPHIWYDIPRVHLVAAEIEAALAAKDPPNKDAYATNLANFNQSLQPIYDKINLIKSQYPGAPVAYTEPVPGYLLADAGLNVKTPEGFAHSIEEGNEPSPADTAAMDDLMTSHSVKVLLYNSQATSPVTQHVRDLAIGAGIPVVGVTETLPQGAKNYQAWQLDQLNAIIAALTTK